MAPIFKRHSEWLDGIVKLQNLHKRLENCKRSLEEAERDREHVEREISEMKTAVCSSEFAQSAIKSKTTIVIMSDNKAYVAAINTDGVFFDDRITVIHKALDRNKALPVIVNEDTAK